MNTATSRRPSAPHISSRPVLSRRCFLRGAGIAMALPLLDSMMPAFARVADQTSPLAGPGGTPRRMFGVCNNLGLLPGGFFPKNSGRDYSLSPYLELLREHRDDFTVFSGV